MRKNARAFNAVILTILLIGVIAFAIKLNISFLKYAPIDKAYSEQVTTDLDKLEDSTIMGKLENENK